MERYAHAIYSIHTYIVVKVLHRGHMVLWCSSCWKIRSQYSSVYNPHTRISPAAQTRATDTRGTRDNGSSLNVMV